MDSNDERRATFPADELHRTLPRSHAAHSTIDRLQSELKKASPNSFAITEHAGALLGIRELEATIAHWWGL